MIKALFFDLDGTLLTTGKTLHPTTPAALRRCREKGIRVFLATARSPRLDKMLHWTEAEFSLFDGGLYCNGACVLMGEERRYAYIDPRAAREVYRQVESFPEIHMSLHMEGDLHAFNHRLPDDMLGPWGVQRTDILPMDDHAFRHAVKILIYRRHLVDAPADPLPSGLYEALTQRCGDLANIYLTDGDSTIQVAGKDSGKHTAITRTCRELGLAPHEIAVFGDDLNDTEMLAACPNSVAMGNGHPQAKQAAACLTLSNDEGGIAHALEHILCLI